mmetsp:Transcript_45137/g.90136  ORF Transcript_45137/g.90136 Transcript_45137/m.90136 type:complete len:127 (+) Transcript_45137:49-429(+)
MLVAWLLVLHTSIDLHLIKRPALAQRCGHILVSPRKEHWPSPNTLVSLRIHFHLLFQASIADRGHRAALREPLAPSPLAPSPVAASPLVSSPLASSSLAASPLAASPLATCNGRCDPYFRVPPLAL